MEAIENSQQVPHSQTLEDQSVFKNIQNEKGNFLLIAGVITLVLIAIAGVFYLGVLRSSPIIQTPRPATATATATATALSPTLSPSSNSLTLFSQLSNSTQNEEAEAFSDNILKVSFSYPKKYFSQSFKADEKNLYAGIFFLKERGEEKEKYIAYAVNCELDNRRDPAGVCRESTAGDLEVSINPASKVPDYDEDKSSSYNQCEKETITDNKIIYACSTQLSIDPADRGMIYSLYLTADAPKVIRISTRQPEDFSDLIRSIVNSAKALP